MFAILLIKQKVISKDVKLWNKVIYSNQELKVFKL